MVERQQKLGRRVIEKSVVQIAASFPIDIIANQVIVALPGNPGWTHLRARVLSESLQAEALWAKDGPSLLPTLDDIRLYARAHLAQNVSVDEIAISARRHLFELVHARLVQITSEHE